jgi:uncharacterized protein YkwD
MLCSSKVFSHGDINPKCTAANFSTCGENIAWNQELSESAPTKAMNQWINSAGHYRNLVSTEFTHVGYGYKVCGDRVYWAGLYGKPKSGN